MDTDHGVLTMAVGQYRDGTAYSEHCLTLRDVSGFRKLFQNRNITIYNHSHFKWIWLISNDQLRCN